MQLIDAFVRNPVKVAVGVWLLVLFGMVALWRMPMQLTPEVETPTLSIETRWPGASPQEVEREIIQEQEEQLKGVEGVRKMTSESRHGSGEINLEFTVGTDLTEALVKVNARLQQVQEYPDDVQEATIKTTNTSDRSIAWFYLRPRAPSREQIIKFQAEHPESAELLEPVLRALSTGQLVHRLNDLVNNEKIDAGLRQTIRSLLPPDIDTTKLYRFAEDYIEAAFERVDGVADSRVIGGQEEELQVVVDAERLAARQLTIDDVRTALVGHNKDTSGGDVWDGKRRWVVRTLGQFRRPEQVANSLVAYRDGLPVYVRDVADVRLGYKKADGLARNFGLSALAVNCQRETGANVMEVMAGLRETSARLNDGILQSRGLQLEQVYDETDYIDSAIGLVEQNIFIGGALTMIVLMLFLHLGVRTLLVVPAVAVSGLAAAYVSPWLFAICLALILAAGFWFARGALIVGLAIPTSIIGTFLVLQILGRSLNVISLAGLAFAVGMLVDNAVVVLENIYRHFQSGDDKHTAAVRGAEEVWGAVVASTLTTLAVFLPVLFVQQEAGQLFRDIALAVSSAVGLSLLISITLIPTLSAKILHRSSQRIGSNTDWTHPGTSEDNGRLHVATNGHVVRRSAVSMAGVINGSRMVRVLEGLGRGFVDFIVGINGRLQASVALRLTTVVGFVAGAFLLSYLLAPKVEYLPSGNRNLVIGFIQPPAGYNLERLTEMGALVEARLRPFWDVSPEVAQRDDLKYPVIRDFFFIARGTRVFMGVRTQNPLRASDAVDMLREVGRDIPGTIVVAKQTSLFERGLSAGRTVDVEITGPELEQLVALGGSIMARVAELIPEAQAIPKPSLDISTPELHARPRWDRAGDLGISAVELGYAVDALIDGARATDYFIGGDRIDLSILGEDRMVQRTQDVRDLQIAAPGGQVVKLSTVADVQLGAGPEQINHRERLRAITVEVTPPSSMALQEAMEVIRQQIIAPLERDGKLDGGYQISLSGTADKLTEAWDALWFNLLLALMITYLLMAALFESWLYPLVIIFSVPLGAAGGFIGLWVLNLFVLQPLDVLTMLGFVVLIGTVVNNPILIVHQSLNLMRAGRMAPRDAILESVRTRIRPIFMTTLTTVLGLLPLVVIPGAGSELYRGLGSVVLGGLLVSAMFTLVLVPTLFSLAMDAREAMTRLVWSETSVAAEPVPQESPAPRPRPVPRPTGKVEPVGDA